MSGLNEQSSLNEFWEAITEIVQGDTPSPAEPELELDHFENYEPQKFTYYVNPAVESYSSFSGSQFPYICSEEKLQSQSFIDLILNKDIQDKQDKQNVFQNLNFIDSFVDRDKNGKEKATCLPGHNLTPMNPSVYEAGQISFNKSLIQNESTKVNNPVNKSTVSCTPSSEFHEEDGDEEKVDKQFTLHMDLDGPMSESKPLINDNDLIQSSIRDLNRKLKLYPEEEQQKLKQRRRLLKNRGYAQTCRVNRINTQKTLFEENQRLKELLEQTNIEKNIYKTKYEHLKSMIRKAKMDRESKRESSNI